VVFARERTCAGPFGCSPRPRSGEAAAAPSLLALQRAIGNRAVATLLARAPSGAAGAAAAGMRKIVVDANVFDQIARGNVEAANTLMQLARTEDVYISWEAFQRWGVKATNAKQTNALKRVLDELHIKQAPPPPAAVLKELETRNSYVSGKQLRTILDAEDDLKVAAEARALGGEVFSLDSAFRNGAVQKTLGVRVARESTAIKAVAGQAPRAKQSRMLRLLGIKEEAVAGHLPAGPGQGTGRPTAEEGQATAVKQAQASGSGEAEHAAAGEVKSSTVKQGEQAAVNEVERVAVKQGEQVAVKEAGRLWPRLAAKVGLELLEALVPGPLDAVGLLIDVANAYAEAKEEIRKRNLRNGVAFGLAAYLVVPRWQWAKQFQHRVVERDVVTQVLDAVGVAENAFNEGLVRGYLFGERHTVKQADALRQRAFEAIRHDGRSVGRQVEEDVWQFDADDVYTFGGVLIPVADWFLAEADRRRKEREEREQRERNRASGCVGMKC
jgi:predicted nucleic acid-binding protein